MEEQIQGITMSEERIKELLKANGLSPEEKKEEWLSVIWRWGSYVEF